MPSYSPEQVEKLYRFFFNISKVDEWDHCGGDKITCAICGNGDYYFHGPFAPSLELPWICGDDYKKINGMPEISPEELLRLETEVREIFKDHEFYAGYGKYARGLDKYIDHLKENKGEQKEWLPKIYLNISEDV